MLTSDTGQNGQGKHNPGFYQCNNNQFCLEMAVYWGLTSSLPQSQKQQEFTFLVSCSAISNLFSALSFWTLSFFPPLSPFWCLLEHLVVFISQDAGDCCFHRYVTGLKALIFVDVGLWD